MNFVQTAGDLLNVSESLHHVVKVGLAGVVDFLVLPVGEAVAESTKLVSVVDRNLLEYLRKFDPACDDRVHAAIGPAVPTVCRADLDTGEGLRNLTDPTREV